MSSASVPLTPWPGDLPLESIGGYALKPHYVISPRAEGLDPPLVWLIEPSNWNLDTYCRRIVSLISLMTFSSYTTKLDGITKLHIMASGVSGFGGPCAELRGWAL